MQVQYEAVVDRTPLTEGDYETDVATLMSLVRTLFPQAASGASEADENKTLERSL